MNQYIRDERGQVLGYTQQQGNQKMYYNANGTHAARIHDNRTYDNKGMSRGNGDQGARLLGNNTKKK